ncbi:MAG: ribosome hibernation-promoting factor, HPF/YfiA family [Armatimonadota bacterium]
MRVESRGKNVRITSALREHAQERLEKLSRFFDHLADAQVTISFNRGQHRADILLNVNGLLLRAEERADEVHTAIDRAADKLERQLVKFKEKLQSRARVRLGEAAPIEAEPASAPGEAEATEESADELTIVRAKRFAMKPMTPEEAALQMELLHHDFYVFRNGESSQVNVIYRRKDGTYGLIEPEV